MQRTKCTLSARVDRKTIPHSRQGTGWGSSNSTARDSALAALAVSVLQAAGNSCQTAHHARRPSSGSGSCLSLGSRLCICRKSSATDTVQARGLASTVCRRALSGSGQFASRGAICRRRSMRSTPGIAGRLNISRICASVVPPT